MSEEEMVVWTVATHGSVDGVFQSKSEAEEWIENRGNGLGEVVRFEPALTAEQRDAIRFFVNKHKEIQREGASYCCLEASPNADTLLELISEKIHDHA